MTTAQPPSPVTAGGRPEPVLGAAAVASGLTTVVGLVLTVLVLAHVLTPEGSATLGPALGAALPAVVGAVSTVLAALHSRGKVTPLSDPRSALGVPLVSVNLVKAAEGTLRSQQTPGPDHAAQ